VEENRAHHRAGRPGGPSRPCSWSPCRARGAFIPPPEGYLTALRALCRENGILFVADEVITAFGRLGAWFASELWKLDPDLITLAKADQWLPAARRHHVSDEIAETLIHGGYFAHGFTYTGHPTACAAGLANLEVIENDGLIPRVRGRHWPLFSTTAPRVRRAIRAVGEVRGTQLSAPGTCPPRRQKPRSLPR